MYSLKPGFKKRIYVVMLIQNPNALNVSLFDRRVKIIISIRQNLIIFEKQNVSLNYETETTKVNLIQNENINT